MSQFVAVGRKTYCPKITLCREKAVFCNIFMNIVIFIFYIVVVASSGSPRGGKSRRY